MPGELASHRQRVGVVPYLGKAFALHARVLLMVRPQRVHLPRRVRRRLLLRCGQLRTVACQQTLHLHFKTLRAKWLYGAFAHKLAVGQQPAGLQSTAAKLYAAP